MNYYIYLGDEPFFSAVYIKPAIQIWNDSGSGARMKTSFWTASNNQLQHDYKLLGDSVCNGRSQCEPLLAIKDIKENVDGLKEPVNFEYFWHDENSGADNSVKVYRLIPPDGFQCLGYVAVDSYDKKPDLNKYRCVNEKYLQPVKYSKVLWEDSGSGVPADFAAYSLQSTSTSLQSGTFIGETNHNFGNYIGKSEWSAIKYDLVDINQTGNISSLIFASADLISLFFN